MGPALMTISDEAAAAGGIIATAIHAGHALRGAVESSMQLTAWERFHEEDPWTDRLAATVPVRVIVHRSRFEVDLNRDRAGCVYERPADAWGLDVWKQPLASHVVAASRVEHDEFYRTMRALLDAVAAAGPFVVLDVHSYNHRRCGPDAPPEAAVENPEVNVGTGTLDRHRFGGLVDGFIDDLGRAHVAGRGLDVRENVRFRGGYLSKWVNDRYAGIGCALAVEFKKTFMDEWTEWVDEAHLDELGAAVGATLPGLRRSLGALS